MSVSIVLATCTEDEAKTADELRALGFKQETVWVKFHETTEEAKTKAARDLSKVGVAQFIAGVSYWGRGPE